MSDKQSDTKTPLIHELKTWTDSFWAMKLGNKTAELRVDDRGFKVGEFLMLRRYCPKTNVYFEDWLFCKITHILRDAFDIPNGHVMLSFVRIASGSAPVSEDFLHQAAQLMICNVPIQDNVSVVGFCGYSNHPNCTRDNPAGKCNTCGGRKHGNSDYEYCECMLLS